MNSALDCQAGFWQLAIAASDRRQDCDIDYMSSDWQGSLVLMLQGLFR